MLLTITNRRLPATDLGYLLHKNPARLQSIDIAGGQAHVFYPEATDTCCTAALLLDLDPIALVRGRGKGRTSPGLLDHYVNDRPYVASSFLSVAMGKAFRTALAGRSKERPELVDEPLPLETTLAAVPCRGGEPVLRRLFEPLGYTLDVENSPLDEAFPAWGASSYYRVVLSADVPLKTLLSHLYVLVPVLDDAKHYWVGDDEVDKLLRHGEGWLESHPEREFVARRYLFHQRRLTDEALARLMQDESADPDQREADGAKEEAALEERLSLNQQRIAAVVAQVVATGGQRTIDLGCGDGKLLKALLRETRLAKVAGMDVSCRSLAHARRRLDLERLPDREKGRIALFQGSLMYRDERLKGYDVATVTEVIEHLDPPCLAVFERVVFGDAKPQAVIVTTPNVEFNATFDGMPAGQLRHRDHRFEWSRSEFEEWADRAAEHHQYDVKFHAVGECHPEFGPPTQMAVFVRRQGVEALQ